MNHALVSLTDVRVRLGGKEILKGVTTSVPHGQITALIGLNGCGKTTLLRTVLKEIPHAGEITFHCGHDHRQPTPQHVGYVPQKLNFDVNLPLTVGDLLALALQRRPLFLGISRRVRRTMIAILENVGIAKPAEKLDSPVAGLSGGELQRVLMGLALYPQPELLLLDEPAAGIDFKDQEKFYQLISRVNRDNRVTILLVSHDLNVVSKVVNNVICLKDGRVQCEAAPQQMTPEMLRQTFGGDIGLYVHHHHHPQATNPS
jgi:ABC-type Mn2+/Zn2+ transport system ATPase subunit